MSISGSTKDHVPPVHACGSTGVGSNWRQTEGNLEAAAVAPDNSTIKNHVDATQGAVAAAAAAASPTKGRDHGSKTAHLHKRIDSSTSEEYQSEQSTRHQSQFFVGVGKAGIHSETVVREDLVESASTGTNVAHHSTKNRLELNCALSVGKASGTAPRKDVVVSITASRIDADAMHYYHYSSYNCSGAPRANATVMRATVASNGDTSQRIVRVRPPATVKGTPPTFFALSISDETGGSTLRRDLCSSPRQAVVSILAFRVDEDQILYYHNSSYNRDGSPCANSTVTRSAVASDGDTSHRRR